METKHVINELSEESDKRELVIPDQCIHESVVTMSDLIDRAEGIMRRYPWVVLTMGAGLGYVASRRLP